MTAAAAIKSDRRGTIVRSRRWRPTVLGNAASASGSYFFVHARPNFGRLTMLRALRKLVAVLMLTSYLLAGALHTVCDVEMTGGQGTSISTSAKKDMGSEKLAIASHHCHGCFSASMPSHSAVAIEAESASGVAAAAIIVRSGRIPGIEPPPPKFLT